MTPIIDPEGTLRGEVQGVLPVTTALVRYMDGFGKEDVRLAIVIPGGGVHFFHSSASGTMDLRPSQKWLAEAIQKHLKEVGPDSTSLDKASQV